MRASTANEPGRGFSKKRGPGKGDKVKISSSSGRSSPYIISNPYKTKKDREAHVMTRAKTAGTALDRVRGPTSESAHLANAILEAESTLNGTARDMALKVNNQTLEESYFRS